VILVILVVLVVLVIIVTLVALVVLVIVDHQQCLLRIQVPPPAIHDVGLWGMIAFLSLSGKSTMCHNWPAQLAELLLWCPHTFGAG